MVSILGISAFYHDSAAALIIDGDIKAAAQEERFTRKKHDDRFPENAIRFCLSSNNVALSEIDYIIFYDKPLLKFERILETYLSFAPRGFGSFVKAMPVWLKEKLFLKVLLRKELCKIGNLKKKELPTLLFNEHHNSHAASAYFASPFDEAVVLCLDGVGEWATTSIWHGVSNKMEPFQQLNFPHSLGLLYSAFTYYLGFKVNSGEYKLMGLAPYGEPKYAELIFEKLLNLRDDGSFELNLKYFDFTTGLRMTSEKFHALFGAPPRTPETEISQRDMDLASSIQKVTEEIVLKMVNKVSEDFSTKNLCLAGGVALNCVANGRILRESQFENLWVQPAAGDAGGAVGAALTCWHEYLGQAKPDQKNDRMHGAFLGPAFSNSEVKYCLDDCNAVYEELEEKELCRRVAKLIANGEVVGWFRGRMEFGPRALGGRSILGDARNPKMQSNLNLKIKFRESFRPFAPIVKREDVNEWFDLNSDSPYMLIVAPVNAKKLIKDNKDSFHLTGLDRLGIQRSTIPAVTHVDNSARIQTVQQDTNPTLYSLLDEFQKLTGCPVLVNTSFNVRNEPIVCTPLEAYQCFMRTNMDYLVLENYLLYKGKQPTWNESDDWQQSYELD